MSAQGDPFGGLCAVADAAVYGPWLRRRDAEPPGLLVPPGAGQASSAASGEVVLVAGTGASLLVRTRFLQVNPVGTVTEIELGPVESSLDDVVPLAELTQGEWVHEFGVPSLHPGIGHGADELRGRLALRSDPADADGTTTLHVQLENVTPVEPEPGQDLTGLSMAGAHVVLAVDDGRFVADPSGHRGGWWAVVAPGESAVLLSPVATSSAVPSADRDEVDELLAMGAVDLMDEPVEPAPGESDSAASGPARHRLTDRGPGVADRGVAPRHRLRGNHWVIG